MRQSLYSLVFGSVLFLPVDGAGQPHWPQFRGPNGQGISIEGQPPITFGLNTNLVWKTETLPGHSSPCVWGDTVFITAVDGKKLMVFAFNRKTGHELWKQSIEVEKVEKHHAVSSPVSPTPAADSERVYAYFGSFGVAAYTHTGEKAWQHPIPTPKNKYGMATSPVLYGQALILVQDVEQGASRILALENATGKKLWEEERSLFSSGWSTPMIWSNGEQSEVVVLGSGRLTAYDAGSGQKRWWVDGFPQETVGIPVTGNGLIFASSAALGGRGNQKVDTAFGWKDLLQHDRNKDGQLQADEIPADYRMVLRPELPKDHPGYAFPPPFKGMFAGLDSNKDEALSEEEWNAMGAQFETFSSPVMMAIRPGGTGDVTKSRVLWKVQRGIPETPSPLLYRGLIYLVRDGGLVTCLNADDGKVQFQERLGAAGQYCASPIAAAGRIYIASQAGTIAVIEAGESSLKVLSTTDLGEPIFATPAIVEQSLIVRTRNHLFAFGK